MGKVKTNKARKPKSDGTECSAEVVALLEKIVAEQKTVDGQEANAVAAVLRISLHLAELRPLAKKTWAQQLGAIGMCTRVASRYLKIAKSGLAAIGLRESDLTRRLPLDVMRLSWICRVPEPQLPGLLDKIDLKKASRDQVIDAVRKELGVDPPAKARDGHLDAKIQRALGRLVKAAQEISDQFPRPEDQSRARELLAAGLQQVLNVFEAKVTTPAENEFEATDASPHLLLAAAT
jgi:hypothetical protein